MVVILITVAAPVAWADYWYEHYDRAKTALDNGNWERAIEELQQALERKGDSGARVRSYGMKVIAYFPYLKLGIAYYHLGQPEAALQAFQTEEQLGAIAASESACVFRAAPRPGTSFSAPSWRSRDRVSGQSLR